MPAARDAGRPSRRALRVNGSTVHVVQYAPGEATPGLVSFAPAQTLAGWCLESGALDAVSAGYFVRPFGPAIGELWISGRPREMAPVEGGFGQQRGTLMITPGGRVVLGARRDLPARPKGDLVQAGPMLARSGRVCLDLEREGFAVTAGQFDLFIDARPEPRCAIATTPRGGLTVAVCDGRRPGRERGMLLADWADTLVDLGAHDALNLDGGSSCSLVVDCRLVNRPMLREGHPLPGGRVCATALVMRRTVVPVGAPPDGSAATGGRDRQPVPRPAHQAASSRDQRPGLDACWLRASPSGRPADLDRGMAARGGGGA